MKNKYYIINLKMINFNKSLKNYRLIINIDLSNIMDYIKNNINLNVINKM